MNKRNISDNGLIKKKNILKIIKKENKRISKKALGMLITQIEKNIHKAIRIISEEADINARKTINEKDVEKLGFQNSSYPEV